MLNKKPTFRLFICTSSLAITSVTFIEFKCLLRSVKNTQGRYVMVAELVRCLIYEMKSLKPWPCQTDSQVVASRRKLNLRRHLRWVAKGTRKFPRKYTQVEKTTISRLQALFRVAKMTDISRISLADRLL